MTTPTFKPPWKLRIKKRLMRQNSVMQWPDLIRQQSRDFIQIILISLCLVIVLALTGCCDPVVIVKPPPPLPAPPPDLMREPRNIPLVPEHLRPSVSKPSATQPVTPSN